MSKTVVTGRSVKAPTALQAARSADGITSYRVAQAHVTAPRSRSQLAKFERVLTLRPNADLRDALPGIRGFDCPTGACRRKWLDAGGAAVPAATWEAFKLTRDGL